MPTSNDKTVAEPTDPNVQPVLNLHALRHGRANHVFVFAADDSKAFVEHCAAIKKHYAPFGPIEEFLADRIAGAMWRLERVGAIEEGIFALDAAAQPEIKSGASLDSAGGPAQTWLEKSKALNQLAQYENRIRRALEQDKTELLDLQKTRKEQAAQAMDQAVALHALAKQEGKPYDPAKFFKMPLPALDSVFSTETVAAESARREAWAAAQSRLGAAKRP